MKEHKKHGIPKPGKGYHKQHKVHSSAIRIKKKFLVISAVLVLILLAAIAFYSFSTKPKAVASESMLYLYPSSCVSEICNPEEIGELIKDVSVSFYKAGFVRAPILLVPQQEEMKIIQVETKASILEGLCNLGNEDFCDKAKKEEYMCEGIQKSEKPTVLLFYMSYCPYGQQAFRGLYPVLKLFGNRINFEPHFVIYENYRGGGSDYCIADGKICSMHGTAELNEGIREACVYKLKGLDAYLEYTKCVMDSCSLSNVEECWQSCAEKNNLDVQEIDSCKSTQAYTIMTKEKELNAEYGATGSPTIILNEQRYSGGRAPENFKQSICCGFEKAPSECEQVLGQAATATSGGCG